MNRLLAALILSTITLIGVVPAQAVAQVSSLSNFNLCLYATKEDGNWNRSYSKHIAEVKRRGLGLFDCAKVTGRPIPEKLDNEEKSRLCELATLENGLWDSRSGYIGYVQEAKKRGLTRSDCAKLTDRPDPIAKAKEAALIGQSDKNICLEATTAGGRWEAENTYFTIFTNEATRRGLTLSDCAQLTGRPDPLAKTTETASNKWDGVWEAQSDLVSLIIGIKDGKIYKSQFRETSSQDWKDIFVNDFDPRTAEISGTLGNIASKQRKFGGTFPRITTWTPSQGNAFWTPFSFQQLRTASASADTGKTANQIDEKTHELGESDRGICDSSTSLNGNWAEGPIFQKYIQETIRRGLSLSDCAKLTGRPDPSAKTTEITANKWDGVWKYSTLGREWTLEIEIKNQKIVRSKVILSNTLRNEKIGGVRETLIEKIGGLRDISFNENSGSFDGWLDIPEVETRRIYGTFPTLEMARAGGNGLVIFHLKRVSEPSPSATTKASAPAPKANPPLGDLRDKTYAKQLLDDVRAFVALNPSVLDPMILGRFYNPALNEVKSNAFKNAGSSFLQLAEAVKSNDAFSAYHKTAMDKRFAKVEAKRLKLQESLRQSLADVKAKIASDPLAPVAPKLIEIFGRYETIKSDASLDVLEQAVAGLRSELSKVGMVVASSEAKAKKAAPAPKPIKKSAANLKQLSDIRSEDAVLLVNLSGDAPNAFRDLNGKPAFEKKQVKLCAPALGSLKRKHRAYVRNSVTKALPGHTIKMVPECKSYKGYDGVLATGANFAKGDGLPSADRTARRLKGNKLVRLTVIEAKDFNRELAKRDILSSQYKADIEQGARNGYGAISYDNESEVACVADIKDTTGHDRALKQVADARQFDEAVESKSATSVTATEAFKQAQRGNCGLIYGSASTLKTLLQASATAGLSGDVLPVWITPSAIDQRAKQIAAGEKDSQEAEGARRAELQKRQAEAAAKRKAEAEQLEARQRQYRAQHGAKVASLVSVIDQQLGDVRSGIDKALAASSGVKAAVDSQNFWSPYPAWYADQRKKGWVFESTVPSPKDYGVAKWKGRQIETVIAEIKVLMKNPDLGEYAETCWTAGYINDAEFKRYREPLITECKNSAALDTWRGQHSFDTRWDLGVK